MPGPMAPGAHGAQRKPKNAGKTFGRLAGYFKPHLFSLIVIIVGLLISAGAGVAGTYLLKPIINQIEQMVQTKSSDFTVFFTYLGILTAVNKNLVGVTDTAWDGRFAAGVQGGVGGLGGVKHGFLLYLGGQCKPLYCLV